MSAVKTPDDQCLSQTPTHRQSTIIKTWCIVTMHAARQAYYREGCAPRNSLLSKGLRTWV